MLDTSINRRIVLGAIAAACCRIRCSTAEESADRSLLFTIKNDFGSAPTSNIERLLQSVANEIWKHCGATTFKAKGFWIYRHDKHPITHFKHDDEDRIVIGLNTRDTSWAQYSYQFAHEFCHALIDHTGERQKQWHSLKHANHWFDECLCETASLFALRAMSKSWLNTPPYPNWKSFAPHLASYVDDRLKKPEHQLPAKTDFVEWFRNELASLRANSTQREKNTIVASRLLPIFEAGPSGWESVTALKIGLRDELRSFDDHLVDWRSQARPELQSFVAKISEAFGIAMPENS